MNDFLIQWWNKYTYNSCHCLIPSLFISCNEPQGKLTSLFVTYVSDGLSTLAIVLIIVGCTILLLAILAMLLCMCALMRRQYEAGLTNKQRWRQPFVPRRNDVFYEDDIHSRVSTDGSFDTEEQRRMNRLMQVMNKSPYIQRVSLLYTCVPFRCLIAHIAN